MSKGVKKYNDHKDEDNMDGTRQGGICLLVVGILCVLLSTGFAINDLIDS